VKIIVAQPGASVATEDVFRGLWHGLEKQGHDLIKYRLDIRIERAATWLAHCWKKAGKPDPRPNDADVLYQATEGILEKALRFEADFILVVSAMYFHPDFFVMFNRMKCQKCGNRNIGLGLVFTESPYDDEQQLRLAPFADICWVNERTSVDIFRKVNPNTFYLPHAYHPEKHKPKEPEERVAAHDVVFVGTGFQERIDLLSAVDWEGIDLGLYGHWSLLPSRHRLRRYIKSTEIDNDTTAALYQRAKVGLNLYRQSMGFGRNVPRINHAESLNPRAYELAACGRFYLSEYRKESEEVFGSIVPTFKDAGELGPLIKSWLRSSEVRQRVSRKLPDVVREHNWEARAEQVSRDLAQVCA
jgi:spore maturation protein CgeB